MMGSDMLKNVPALNQKNSPRRAVLRHFTALASLVAMNSVFVQSTHAAAPTTAAKRLTLLVVGDSLSAEYGLARGSGWVALLEKQLALEKRDAVVVNASISGDTTSGGRSRLAALLRQHKPTHVILELGANDALRGLPLGMTQTNLTEMAKASKAAGAAVVVVGMQMPPNYGRKYADDFYKVFAAVAKSESAALVPFFLKGVADVPDAEALFQADRIHPKAQAHPAMFNNVWVVLKPLLG
jgi:acyl-CoA thioesterase I